jgi:hypothetical protein
VAKCRGDWRGYLKHGLIHTALLILLTHPYFSAGLVLLWLLLPAAHILLDLLKNRLLQPGHPADSLRLSPGPDAPPANYISDLAVYRR